MKNSALKKFLFSGILIWGSLAGGLLSCGKEELLAAGKEVYPQRVSINGELQWKLGFHWDYFPQSENSEKIGYFVSKEGRKKQMKEAKQQIRGTMDVLPNGKMIEVWHDRLSEEEFFGGISGQARELTEKYPEEEVVYRINGSTEADQFVQLDAGGEHQLYIRAGDSVYILYGEMDSEKWQNFLEEWLFTFGLKWNGLSVMKEEGTVLDPYTGDKKTGRRTMLQCGKDWIKIDKNILLFHRQGEGFYLKTGFTEYEREVEETILCLTENYPKYDSAAETVSYFQNQYPEMYSLNAYLLGEDTLWNFEESMLENIFYEVEDLEGIHGLFFWNGTTYEMFSRNSPVYYKSVQMAKAGLGYDSFPFLTWQKEAEESISQSDYLADAHFYIRDLGGGKVIQFQAEAVKTETAKNLSGDYEKNNTYQIKIYDEKELLQEIQVNVIQKGESPFLFEDFNADGYLDLTVVCWLGTFGGSVRHYIYDSSERKFMELDSEFEYCVDYFVEPETRRLRIYSYGPAITGREAVYQWKNETDYEILKQFLHEETEGFVRVKISRYEKGREEILSDYLYSREEYIERSDIWGTYREDFIWEKEVTDRTTEKKYMIRYAEVFREKYARENGGSYYEGRIYVYDEDTYLIGMTSPETSISKSDSIIWEDGGRDKEQALVIHYVDGGELTFYLSELILPDYQPNE